MKPQISILFSLVHTNKIKSFKTIILFLCMQENKIFPKVNLYPLSANLTKWSKTVKQFVSNLPTNCFSLFDRFVEFVLKG